MVDVDRGMASLTLSHAAGLRRLSARAATSASSSSPRNGLLPLRPLADSILSHLRSTHVPVLPGLSDSELARAEAEFSFSFPPDLRALLALGLPSGPSFPDWRSSPRLLRPALDLPVAAASLQIARGALWPRSWGPRPADPDRALKSARAALRRAPLLIPLSDHCYIPCRPSLAGNPVFFVDQDRILCCAFDLSDFFLRDTLTTTGHMHSEPLHRRQLSGLPPLSMRRSLDSAAGKSARWIEFWSDAASERRRRISSSSEPSVSSASSSPDLNETRKLPLPHWLDMYLDKIGSVLRSGGWRDSEVCEMMEVSASGMLDDAEAVDGQAVLDVLLVKADRCSDSLRRGGWSAEDVAEALGVDFLRGRGRRPAVRLPPAIVMKIERLAAAVS